MSDIDLPPRKTVPLSKPVANPFPDKPIIKEVVLKEPTGGLYRRLGEPRIVVRTGQGGAYYVEQNDAISSYLENCIVHELGGDLINLLSLADAMRVKMELFGFFTDAEQTALQTS